MKKLFLMLFLFGFILTMHADITGTGYYRVKNYGSSRWASLVDNAGDLDLVAASADLHALNLTKDSEMIMSDPGSIVFIKKVSGNQYDVAAQGTSLQALIDHPINIGPDGTADGQTLYRIWGTLKGVTRYIADGNIITSDEEGFATIKETSNVNFMKWLILPVDVTSSDNFFGTVPNVTVNDNLYTTLFSSFSYKPYSDGVKAYYIGRVGFGMAEMIEIDGDVPAGSPVIIQCAGTNVSDNKLQLSSSEDALPNNSLQGVYFNYKYNNIVNQVVYDPDTMRVLGVCSDGSLGFVTANIATIPANSAYLKVPPGSLPEFKCVTTNQYEANLSEAPEMFYYGNSQMILPQDDYNYTGTLEIAAPEGNNKNVSIQFTTYSGSDEKVIGPYNPVDTNLTFANSKSQSFPFSYNSKNSWILPNWEGGQIDVTINILYQSVTFSAKSAGIESIISSNKGIHYSDNMVYTDSYSDIKIYNISGEAVLKGSGTSLDISGLPKGIYIATANGESIKIVR